MARIFECIRISSLEALYLDTVCDLAAVDFPPYSSSYRAGQLARPVRCAVVLLMGAGCCVVTLAAVLAVLAAGWAVVLDVETDAAWKHASSAEFLEAAEAGRRKDRRKAKGLPSSYKVLNRDTQRLYVRTSIRASEVPQCTDDAVDCTALPVGDGTREWCAGRCSLPPYPLLWTTG